MGSSREGRTGSWAESWSIASYGFERVLAASSSSPRPSETPNRFLLIGPVGEAMPERSSKTFWASVPIAVRTAGIVNLVVGVVVVWWLFCA